MVILTEKLLELRSKADYKEFSKLEEKTQKLTKLARLCNEICVQFPFDDLNKQVNLAEFSLELLKSIDINNEQYLSIEISALNNLGVFSLR
jgi:hypothetical protein